jgi:hypothetical protein
LTLTSESPPTVATGATTVITKVAAGRFARLEVTTLAGMGAAQSTQPIVINGFIFNYLDLEAVAPALHAEDYTVLARIWDNKDDATFDSQ